MIEETRRVDFRKIVAFFLLRGMRRVSSPPVSYGT